ncbi:MAG: hypothetical protein ACPGED_06295, partial [Flavobacteriales bacterium]
MLINDQQDRHTNDEEEQSKSSSSSNASADSDNVAQKNLNKALETKMTPFQRMANMRAKAAEKKKKKELRKQAEAFKQAQAQDKKQQSTTTTTSKQLKIADQTHNDWTKISKNQPTKKNKATQNSTTKTSNEISSDDSSSSDDETKVDDRTNKKSSKNQTSLSFDKVTRKNQTYFAVKLFVQQSSKPVDALIKSAKEWFKQVKEVDKTCVLYDFRDKNPTRCIHKSKQVPDNITQFKHFFANANPQPKGGFVWVNVWAGYNEETSENIKANMNAWGLESKTLTYIKQLQVKHSVKEQWLLWSTNNINIEKLHHSTQQALKKITKVEHQFSFSWNVLRTTDYNKDEPNKKKGSQYIRALHVEVPTANKTRTYAALGKLFNEKSKIKVHGLDLRLVPTYKREYTSHRKKKILHLISKHNHFLNSISTVTTADFEDIDYYNENLQTSMRQIIMQMETIESINGEDNYPKMYLNIDYSDYHGGYVISYPTYLTKQATDMVPQLPAFLHHLYGDEILTMLKPEAVSLALEEPWDPEKLQSISKIDINLDSLAGEAKNYEWIDNLEDGDSKTNNEFDIESKSIDSAKIRTENFLFKKATDTDSISTFASKRDPAQRAIEDSFQQNKKRRVHGMDTISNDDDSEATSVTKNTIAASSDNSTEINNNNKKDLGEDQNSENANMQEMEESSDNTSDAKSSNSENSPNEDSTNKSSTSEDESDSASNSSEENDELVDNPIIDFDIEEHTSFPNVSHDRNEDTKPMTEDREPPPLGKGVTPERES